MSAETCTRSQCPEMPKVTLDQAVIDLMESIALQESALSHILCAESQKMKTAMGMEELDLCKLLEVIFASKRDEWAKETAYVYPGPIQYWGPSEVCDQTTKTLQLEQAK